MANMKADEGLVFKERKFTLLVKLGAFIMSNSRRRVNNFVFAIDGYEEERFITHKLVPFT